MKFKEFITRQRVAIFVVGIITFVTTLLVSHFIGFESLWGELLIDLASSSLTIVFTALIIDYLRIKEQTLKTKNAVHLAEDELQATCFRIKWRLAQLFGFERSRSGREALSNRKEAREYLDRATEEVDNYLAEHSVMSLNTAINAGALPKYLERLQLAQTELEQTLILYEYALPLSLRERVLTMRSELLVADRLLGFIETSEPLSESNLSLIRVTAQSVYDAVEAVLGLDSQSAPGTPIQSKSSLLR